MVALLVPVADPSLVHSFAPWWWVLRPDIVASAAIRTRSDHSPIIRPVVRAAAVGPSVYAHVEWHAFGARRLTQCDPKG
jgi:hypothetical protein